MEQVFYLVLLAMAFMEQSIKPHSILRTALETNIIDLVHILGELKEVVRKYKRVNHMFVSLKIAMCQTFTGEKPLSGQIIESRTHTTEESEHFCTDMLKKFAFSTAIFQTLAFSFNFHFKFC